MTPEQSGEEWLDVVGSEGTATGERISKPEAHRTGAWHRAAHVWIVTPNRLVLLQRRAAVKENYPSLWDVSSAGHCSAGESAVETAVRETCEELGLTIEPAELRPLGSVREQCVLNDGTYLDNELHDVFLVRREVDVAQLVLQPGEVDDAILIPLEELRARVGNRDPSLVLHAPEEYALLWDAV